jgi:hypothetical protein
VQEIKQIEQKIATMELSEWELIREVRNIAYLFGSKRSWGLKSANWNKRTR